ncbi:MAG: hypothetical protein Q4E11_07150 [Corynebacterium sp.]|uniref:hypothetical protein n=1 Tax=Corynebacterium sp. TaxID=1720 RepID=UPI0026DCF487|nr:hypothetical protein [Corynebacterium sp.]MDO5030347.1 hypothetical protein [Corynebacterium sp.]
MPTWTYDIDGLIQATEQTYSRHPSQHVVISVEALGLKSNYVPPQSPEPSSSPLIRMCSGTYLDCAKWNAMSSTERFISIAKSHVKRKSNVIITSEAAAALHGLPLLLRHATISLANSSRRPRGQRRIGPKAVEYQANALVRRVGTHLHDHDLVEICGRKVTDIPKTVIDICRSEHSENGLIVADAALRQWCTTAELEETLRAYPRARGNRRVRKILAIAGERSESVGESLTKGCIVNAGIASLDDENSSLLQQVDFYDSDGFIGRVDFYLPELNLIIEFDGATKYSCDAACVTEKVLVAERHREKRLQNLGLEVVRLQWSDVLGGSCIGYLQRYADAQRSRISAGGLVFSPDLGHWRLPDLPFKLRKTREQRVLERQRRREKIIRSRESPEQ